MQCPTCKSDSKTDCTDFDGNPGESVEEFWSCACGQAWIMHYKFQQLELLED